MRLPAAAIIAASFCPLLPVYPSEIRRLRDDRLEMDRLIQERSPSFRFPAKNSTALFQC